MIPHSSRPLLIRFFGADQDVAVLLGATTLAETQLLLAVLMLGILMAALAIPDHSDSKCPTVSSTGTAFSAAALNWGLLKALRL